MFGGQGVDEMSAGRGADLVNGGRGGDTMYGRRGADVLRGQIGDDHVYGGYGDDVVYGGTGDDRLRGGRGNDTLRALDGSAFRDVLSCGSGLLDKAFADQPDVVGPDCESNSQNVAPVAVNDTYATNEDTTLDLPVAGAGSPAANDTDADGDPLTVVSVSGATGGTVSISAGAIHFIPTGNLCAPSVGNFDYTVSDGQGGTDAGQVIVDVTCVPDNPTAADDSATVAEDAAATAVTVLANDDDPDGDPLTITSITQPTNGTVVITGGGTGLTYAPDSNYCNSGAGLDDTFTYTLTPGGSTATVSVTVTCEDDAPVAVDDSATVVEDASATAIDVLANDTDVDSGPMTVASVIQPTNGTVVITGDGTGLTYAPNANYCNSPPGTTLDTFTYTLNGDSTATVSVTVTCVQDAPVAVDDSTTVVEDSGTTAVDVLANDTDVDGGPMTVDSVTQPTNGTVVITGGGTGLTYAPNANYCNSGAGPDDTFTYTLNAGSTATVSVTVTCVDDLPVAVNDSATVTLNASVTAIDVLANDTDVDGGPMTVDSVTQPTNGTVVITGGGTGLTYEPDAAYCNDPDPAPADTFTYTLNGSSTATVSVTVTCDVPPVAVDDSSTVTEDSGASAVAVLTNDTDIDGGPKSIASVTQPANGTVVVTGGGTGLTYAPNVNYCNSPPGTTLDTFTYTLTPGSSSATVSMTVTCVDDMPVAVDDSATVAEDSGASPVDVLANDTDTDNGPMSIASVTQPANGTVVITGGGTGLTYAPNANYCNSPSGGDADTFTYTLNGSSTATVSITVTCAADSPVVSTGGTLSYNENDPATAIAPGLTVTDADAGSTITGATVQITANYAAQDVLALANAATHLPITALVAGDTLTLSGSASPAAYQAALRDVTYLNTSEAPSTLTRTVTFTVTDETALSGSDTRDIQVTPVDDSPVAVDDAATVLEDAGATAVPVLANDTDVDGGTKTVQSTTQPTDGNVVITGGGTGLTYQPNPNYCNDPPGTTPDTFTYTLTPGGSTATVSMTVTCVNDAPVADDETFNGVQGAIGNTALIGDDPTDGPPSLASPKKTITGDILAGDADVDGPGPLVVTSGTFATNDGGIVVIESDGDFTFTPAAGTSCSDTSDFFDYTVSDQNPVTAATDVGRVTIAITGCVWYVHNNAAGNAGTSTAPFDTLAQAESASAAGHTIFVFDGDDTTAGYAAGVDLKASQRLVGEAADLQVGSDLLHTGIGANRPTLTDNNADVVALDSGNVVRGIQIDPQGTGGGIAGGSGDAGGTFDDVRIIDSGTAGTQPNLELDTTTGAFDISSLTIDNSAATGTTSGSIGVRLNNAGTVNFASAGTVSITTAGAKGLDATSTSMGAGSVFDDITVTGSGSGGVSMVSTTGTTTFGDASGVDLSLTTTSGAAAALLLSNAGSVSVPSGGTANVNATGGPAVDVASTPGATLDLDNVSSTNSSTDGINIDSLGAGTFSASAASTLVGYAGIGVDLNGGSGAITFAGTFDNGSGNTAEVTGRSGGTATFSGQINDTGDANGGIVVGGAAGLANTGGSTVFSGSTKTLNTGAGDALIFTNSDGHTLTLSGGGLDVDTTTGKGIEATTAGTLNVTGSSNTVDTVAGKALNVSNTDVGASPLAFVRISSNGANGGILLNNTGSNSALTVASTGSGSCTAGDQSGCTGGTIQNTTGVDDGGALPTGTGILLNNTRGVSLNRMYIHDHPNYGVRGTTVVGFTMADSVISGSNGTSALTAHKDGSARFEELTGTVSMSNVAISGGYFTNLMVDNTAGVLNSTLDNVDSGTLDAAGGDDAVQFEGIGTSDMNVDYKNSAITTASGDLFQYIGDGTGGGDLDFTGNTLTNNEPSINTGGGGVALVAGAKGEATMDVLSNSMRDSLTNALTIIKSRDVAAGTNNLVANITNNSIGLAGTANSGSIEGDGMEITTFGDGNATFNVTNNNVHQYNSSAFQFVAGSGVADTGQFNVNFSGNAAGNPGTNPSITLLQGVRVDSGVDIGDTFATCVDFGPNLITGSSDAANKDFRLVASQNTTIRQPGYVGGSTDGAAFAAFAAAAIGSGAQGTAVANAPATFTGTGTTCP